MNPELKAFEKLRSVLINDSIVKECFGDRVYTEHIGSIDRPIYPAISFHLLDSKAMSNVPDMVEIYMQIDLWMPVKVYNSDDVFTLYQQIRSLLHMQSLTDTSLSLKVCRIAEAAIGPIMFDEPTNCRHLPARYRIVAI